MKSRSPVRRWWLYLIPIALVSAAAATRATMQPVPAASDVPSIAPVTAQGRLDTASETRNLVAGRDGVLVDILVRLGQMVSRGQTLAVIGCEDVKAQLDAAQAHAKAVNAQASLVRAGPRSEAVDQARASLAAATSRVRDAADAWHRISGLGPSGTASWRQIVQARNAHDSAQAEERAVHETLAALEHGARPAEVTVAQSLAAEADANADALAAVLRKCVITSPIDGQVLRIYRRPGEFSGASQGTTVLTVGDTRHMIARMEIDERDADRVAIGDLATVWVNGAAQVFLGHVTELAMQMGRKTARALDPSDRFDRDIREAIVAIDDARTPMIVGLRVNIRVESPHGTAHP